MTLGVRALVGLLLAACGGPATTSGAPEPARESRPVWQVRAEGGMVPIDPGPAPDELLDARGCATCHAAIVDEWSRSRHALAWTNGIFQREYAARPQAWCVNCHAPLTTQQANLEGARAAQGVDCATCHVRQGKLVSATRRARSPHETIVDASFGSPAFCADCHQFPFPVLSETGVALRMTTHPMQTTVASFTAGPYAGERDGCLTCHGSKFGHAFPGAHDLGMLQGALEVGWCRREPVAGSPPAAPGPPAREGRSPEPATAQDAAMLEVSVRNAAAGHTVPSGDIHRHMYLRVWASSAPEALFQAFFGRRFDPAPDGGKTSSWDSTLAPGASKHFEVAVAELRGDPDEPINLELVYVYIASEFPRVTSAPSEPTTTSIVRRRELLAALPACAP